MMKENDKLNRLVQMATSGPPEVAPMSARFTAEVVRRAWCRPDDERAREKCWLVGVRWGVAGAMVVMLASVFLNVRALRAADLSSEAMFQQQVAELVLEP